MEGFPKCFPLLRTEPAHQRPLVNVLAEELMNNHTTASLRQPPFSLVARVHLQGIECVSEQEVPS